MFEKDNFAEEYNDLDLRDQKIVVKEFESCSFERCDFTNVEFKNCIFSECSFKHCDLSLISVLDCKFSATTFENCKIIGVDWTKALWESLTILPNHFFKSILNDSSFWGLKLEDIKFMECGLKDVDFREADLKSSDFSDSNLINALFRNTNLESANFTHAINFDIDTNQNNIKGAKFSRYEAVRLLNGLGIKLVD